MIIHKLESHLRVEKFEYKLYKDDIDFFDIIDRPAPQLNEEEQLDTLSIKSPCDYNSFSNIDLDTNNNADLFTYIEVENDCEAVMYLNSTSGYKCFVNDKIVDMNNVGNERRCFTVYIKKGINKISISLYSINNYDRFVVRLYTKQFAFSDNVFALSHSNFYKNIDSITYISDPIDSRGRKDFRIYVFGDPDLYENNITLKMFDFSRFNFDTRTIELNKLFTYDLETNCYPYIYVKDYYVSFEAEAKKRNGLTQNMVKTVFIKDFENLPEELIRNAKLFATHCTKFEKTQIYGCIQRLVEEIENKNIELIYWRSYDLKRLLEAFWWSDYDHYESYFTPGLHRLFYKSNLDGKYEYITINLPNNYNKNKRYPVIFQLAAVDYAYTTIVLDNNSFKYPFIIVDVTMRGVNAASYMGEASVLEIIKFISKMYSIDENRMYIAGYSNGGYATWSIIQNHPDAFAAAYPNAGFPYLPNVNNVTNIPIISYISDCDYLYYQQTDIIKKSLGDNGKKYNQLDLEGLSHQELVAFSEAREAIEFLLEQKLDKYSKKVCFRTERDRHNKAYWIKLHNIVKGKSYANIEAEYTDNSIIVNVENSTGFTIEVPPSVKRKNLEIIVNTQTSKFTNIKNKYISFVLDDGAYKINSKCTIQRTRKGTGLLDIYYGPISIIADTENQYIENTAKCFQSPYTNGYVPRSRTQYPIYKINELPSKALKSNLVFVNTKPIDVEKIGNCSFNIKCDDRYFEYKGRKYEGKYCIMQIIDNPRNNKYNILSIYANDIGLLNKNLFTRKLILPFYSNGLHPYLNNEALIFYNNEFYRINEWGMDMEKVQ